MSRVEMTCLQEQVELHNRKHTETEKFIARPVRISHSIFYTHGRASDAGGTRSLRLVLGWRRCLGGMSH